VVLPAVLAFLGLDTLPGGIDAELRWPVFGALTLVGLRILYWIGPDHSHPSGGLLTWGTLMATALWVAGSLGFSWYVSNFATYNRTFGALGGVIVLLMWLWLSGLVILIGAEIDAALDLFRQRGKVKNDPIPGL
jgi:membrane protein